MPLDEEQLLRLAEEEILAENQRAAVRYEIEGPSGWNPCPLPQTNKRFLANTLRQVVSSNRIRDRRPKDKPVKKRERKFFQSREGSRSNNIIFSPPKLKKPENSASSSKVKGVKEVTETETRKRETKVTKK